MKLTDPITALPFVGTSHAALLSRLNIVSVKDLLYHAPARYDDFSLESNINKLQEGETVTVTGSVASFSFRPTRKQGFTLQKAIIRDETGDLDATWFNQPFLRTVLTPGVRVSLSGSVEFRGQRPGMKNPAYEVLRPGRPTPRLHTGRIVPVYPETRGLSSRWIRSKIALLTGLLPWYNQAYHVVRDMAEWLPDDVVAGHRLIDLQPALRFLHFPPSLPAAHDARRRLGFDELLELQLVGLARREAWTKRHRAAPLRLPPDQWEKFLTALPFRLTADQERVIEDIRRDISKETPMNRLIQGEVGSGKTVVAAVAVAAAVRSGYQAVFMAPTQLLADQHQKTLTDLLTKLGIKIALLTGAKEESGVRGQGSGERIPDLVIGTHALIHKRAKKFIDPEKLALVIIDEQHRFGVSQRARLAGQGRSPHVLSMTATPIPRTVALTAYAELAVSLIRQLPKGRKPVKTWVVPEKKRLAAYEWISGKLRLQQQAFVVCPLIEQSDQESMKSIRAATAEFQALKNQFVSFRLELVHGRIPAGKKTDILARMQKGEIDLLVTTPVVEVGIDVPGATVMVIEGAERFGLAQLHQLRGRVGRSDRQSYCLLFTASGKTDVNRLRALERIHDGLELSELDLKLRGPGEIFSTKQHGFPTGMIADLTDVTAVQEAYLVASGLISHLDRYPRIRERISTPLAKSVSPN